MDGEKSVKVSIAKRFSMKTAVIDEYEMARTMTGKPVFMAGWNLIMQHLRQVDGEKIGEGVYHEKIFHENCCYDVKMTRLA
ncbi:unnamed protein product [Dovyalis caffra]|uniref:Uncharacterized protein n=1 Tax=Dovyalis caffra TaxID=77055 RepID=A0AAV1R233_9ROSI|nr:unnamed protein product [Dovyalis caffra]